MINSRSVVLLQHRRMRQQLLELERRAVLGGKDRIDHPPGPNFHDDVANCCAGVLVTAQRQGQIMPFHRLPTHAIDGDFDPLASPQERAIAIAREEARSGFFTDPGWAPTWHEPDTQQT